MDLKIGRFTYNITKGDKFLDNGACVQLLTQSKERVEWGHRQNPILSKKAFKEVLALPRYKKYPFVNAGVIGGAFIYEVE
jgi:hypothetical protein